VTARVIVLNGGSSSGKSGIARCLQAILPDPFAPDGEVIVGPQFRTLEAAWITGVAAMAQAGARIIVDDLLVDTTRTEALDCARAIAARVR
jgi:chloramphenicol 3-O phosphotransferase